MEDKEILRSEERQNAAWSEVGEFLNQYEDNSGWETDLEVIIASGITPK
jgi:hypothetical protein